MNQNQINLLRRKVEHAHKEAEHYRNRETLVRNKINTLERKERTRRLIVHGANLEHVFPCVVEMPPEETLAFLHSLSSLPGAKELMKKTEGKED